jgi:hypothetical protein
MLTRNRQGRVVQTIEVSNNHTAIVTYPGPGVGKNSSESRGPVRVNHLFTVLQTPSRFKKGRVTVNRDVTVHLAPSR